MLGNKKTVIILSGNGAGDAINGLMTSLSSVCGGNGLNVEYFDVSIWVQADLDRFSRTLESGTVLFALTYLGIGQDFTVPGPNNEAVNIWEFLNIPLIKLHGDSPAYFLDRHKDTPANSINLYVSNEFLEFHRWMLPDSQAISACCDPWLVADAAVEQIDFERKKQGKLIFVKNGGDVNSLVNSWREKLPPAMAKQLHELAELCAPRALGNELFHTHEFVTAYLLDKNIDVRGLKEIVRLYVAQLDDYVRRIKSTMIAKALLPFPVLIQGSYWDHLDMKNARATVVDPVNFHACNTVMAEALGIIDMAPNVDGSCHERMMRAAGLYTFGLTNKSSWLQGLLPGLNNCAFHFTPESIQESVSQALENPAKCIELGKQFGEAFRLRYRSEDFLNHLITLAEYSRLTHARQKPELQPFYVW